MYRHIVLFWLKEPTLENLGEAKRRLSGLLGKIEGLLSVEVEADALHSDRSCDLCLHTTFESREAMDAYRVHPAHVEVQKFMHLIRRQSFAADYPFLHEHRVAKPLKMPRLYGSLGPACAHVGILIKLFDAGMSGVMLSLLHRTHAECAPWLDALHTAASHAGVSTELILAPETFDCLPKNLAETGATGVLLSPLTAEDNLAMLRAPGGPRVFAQIGSLREQEALPPLQAFFDEIFLDRRLLQRNLPLAKVPAAQKSVGHLAHMLGLPMMLAYDMLSSMRDKPVPTAAEAVDVHNAVLDGASSLLLAYETSIGKYPAEAMETLRKLAVAAIA